jgi:NAD(P)-dependent dehydrogenase (short-subunit alcohol dehydrogenase family)
LRAATLNPAYGAAKHGVVGLTSAAASYYGPNGIRVNAVCPGIVMTDMVGLIGNKPDSPASLRIARSPLRRGGNPLEIARTAVWLCSDEASYLTGIALPVDGGLSIIA